MSLKLTKFGGIAPRLHPAKLADTMAQTAQNVNLRRGVIEPIDVDDPFASRYDSNGDLISEVPTADLVSITKPDAPEVAADSTQVLSGGIIVITRGIEHICRPVYGGWLTVTAHTWVEYLDTDGSHVTALIQEEDCTPTGLEHTEAGLTFNITMTPFDYTFTRRATGPYHVFGPRYQFNLVSGTSTGGPDDTYTLPAGITFADPIVPSGVAPLFHDGLVYGVFEVREAAGPVFDMTVDPDAHGVASIHVDFPTTGQSPVTTFGVRLNYVDSSRKTYYYVRTLLTADDEEGPPSDVSDRITLRPGEEVTLDLTLPSGYTKQNLYRSATGNDDFLLLAELHSGEKTYTDYNNPLTTTALPVFGNAPTTAEYFLPGSVIHPAQFAAAAYGVNLYLSDYYRFWVWPEEYIIPFPDTIDGIALAGGTIIVWCDDKVYGVSGNNPEQMSKFLISDAHPLLAASTIQGLGGGVIYATNDGLAFCDGSSVKIVTKEYFSRSQWLDLDPDEYTSKVADNTVYLDDSGAGLRVDLDEQEAAISTYTSLTGTPAVWKSKVFRYDDKIIFDYARIVCDATVTLKVYADHVLAGTYTVSASVYEPIPVALTGLSYANDWEFQFETAGVLSSAEFFERQVIPVESQGLIIRETGPLYDLRRVRLMFKEMGSFSVLRVAARDYTDMTVKLYTGGTLRTTQTVTSDAEIQLPETLPNAREWELELSRADAVYELHLMARQNYNVENGVALVRRESDPFTWRDKRIMSPVPIRFSAGRVLASAYPVTMTLYLGAVTVATISVTDEKAFRLPITRPERLWRMDVVPTVTGTFIHEAALATSMTGLRGG